MSVESIAIVLHHSRAKGAAKLVLIGVANHSGDGGAWPTVATLARYANVSERAVQQAIAKLIRLNELAVFQQAGGSFSTPADKRPNRYEVLVRCPALCDGSTNHRVRDYPRAQPPTLPGLEPVDNSAQSVDSGVKLASPGEVGFTPRGEAGFTRTVTNNPVTTSVGNVTTPRARGRGDCRVCSHSESVCRRLNDRDYDHDYEPPKSWRAEA